MGDPFARRAATEERDEIDTFLVWPRTIPATELAPTDRWGDLDRAHAGLAEDPSRFAGVRPYSPGDPMRRVHARASARLGRPMIKRFEPSRDREVLIALDVQTSDGPAWDLGLTDDEVESLYVVAASVTRSLARRRVAFGLMAAGYTGAETRIAQVPVSSAPGQAERILDLLARLSSHASMPFERLLTVAVAFGASRLDGARAHGAGSASVRDGAPAPRAARRPRRRRGVRSAGRPGGGAGPEPRVRRPPGGDGRPLARGGAPGDRAMSGLLVLLPTILAILAEAAWVSVVAALLQAFTLHPPAVGFAWFLAAAVLGLLTARMLPMRAR